MKLNKKFLEKTNFSILIIIVIGILVMVNFFSYQIFYRFDLTQNKDYSISKASKKTVSELKDVVNIKAYFSKDLPAQLINLRQEVADIIDEYVNYSNNKIKIEFIDPKEDSQTEQELAILGIPQLQFNVLEKDKYQVVNGYLGMVIKYGDKIQTIPVIQNTDDLEYQITAAIKKVISEKLGVVGFWQGEGSADIEKEISVAYKKLAEIYDVVLVDLSSEKKVPDTVNTLILVGPKEKFDETKLKAIDALLMRGGSLLILIDGVKVEEGLLANRNDTSLTKLIESYGIKLNYDLVLDASSGMASFSQGFVTFTTNYAFWPKVLAQGFDQNNASVAKLESLVLPWVSSLDIILEKVKENKVSYLVKSTNRAWTQSSNYNLSPQSIIMPDNTKQYNFAVSLSGKFNSAYNQTSIENGRLIIVGDSDFINDGFLRNNPDNLIFFQNLADSLTLDEDLISIRSKGVSERPIKELSETAKNLIRYSNIFGLTIIVILFGMGRYLIRRRKKIVELGL